MQGTDLGLRPAISVPLDFQHVISEVFAKSNVVRIRLRLFFMIRAANDLQLTSFEARDTTSRIAQSELLIAIRMDVVFVTFKVTFAHATRTHI